MTQPNATSMQLIELHKSRIISQREYAAMLNTLRMQGVPRRRGQHVTLYSFKKTVTRNGTLKKIPQRRYRAIEDALRKI